MDTQLDLQPTARMKRLYHYLVMHLWGEPDDLVIFDRKSAEIPGALVQVHVAIWNANQTCDLTSFMTLGMSELMMPHANYRSELTLAVRGPLSRDVRRFMPMFMANVCEYPFTHLLKLNWWERLSNPGIIPGFSDCPQLLLAPMWGDPAVKHFPAPDTDVKLLSLIPITAYENHILQEHSAAAFMSYCEEFAVDLYAPRCDPCENAGNDRRRDQA